MPVPFKVDCLVYAESSTALSAFSLLHITHTQALAIVYHTTLALHQVLAEIGQLDSLTLRITIISGSQREWAFETVPNAVDVGPVLIAIQSICQQGTIKSGALKSTTKFDGMRCHDRRCRDSARCSLWG